MEMENKQLNLPKLLLHFISTYNELKINDHNNKKTLKEKIRKISLVHNIIILGTCEENVKKES